MKITKSNLFKLGVFSILGLGSCMIAPGSKSQWVRTAPSGMRLGSTIEVKKVDCATGVNLQNLPEFSSSCREGEVLTSTGEPCIAMEYLSHVEHSYVFSQWAVQMAELATCSLAEGENGVLEEGDILDLTPELNHKFSEFLPGWVMSQATLERLPSDTYQYGFEFQNRGGVKAIIYLKHKPLDSGSQRYMGRAWGGLESSQAVYGFILDYEKETQAIRTHQYLGKWPSLTSDDFLQAEGPHPAK
jgi:hypothetical protein